MIAPTGFKLKFEQTVAKRRICLPNRLFGAVAKQSAVRLCEPLNPNLPIFSNDVIAKLRGDLYFTKSHEFTVHIFPLTSFYVFDIMKTQTKERKRCKLRWIL